MQKIRLLIVDDEQDCAESLARALDGDADVEVIATAKDGLDAVAKIETLKPDAVALDIVMPNLDGYGVLSNVDFTKLRKRPVFIVTSGLTGDAFIRKAINAGADYYMLKPVSPKALKERLVECSRVKYSPVAVKDDESEMRQAIRTPLPPHARRKTRQHLHIGGNTGAYKRVSVPARSDQNDD